MGFSSLPAPQMGNLSTSQLTLQRLLSPGAVFVSAEPQLFPVLGFTWIHPLLAIEITMDYFPL